MYVHNDYRVLLKWMTVSPLYCLHGTYLLKYNNHSTPPYIVFTADTAYTLVALRLFGYEFFAYILIHICDVLHSSHVRT